MIKENGIEMVDFKMVDINGNFRHVTIPATGFDESIMKNGIGFGGVMKTLRIIRMIRRKKNNGSREKRCHEFWL